MFDCARVPHPSRHGIDDTGAAMQAHGGAFSLALFLLERIKAPLRNEVLSRTRQVGPRSIHAS